MLRPEFGTVTGRLPLYRESMLRTKGKGPTSATLIEIAPLEGALIASFRCTEKSYKRQFND